MSDCNKKIPIIDITQGDDSNALGKQILIHLNTSADLTGCSAIFQVGDFTQTWADITELELEVVIPREATALLPIGSIQGALKIVDSDGRTMTVCRNIMIRVSPKVVINPEDGEFGSCGC